MIRDENVFILLSEGIISSTYSPFSEDKLIKRLLLSNQALLKSIDFCLMHKRAKLLVTNIMMKGVVTYDVTLALYAMFQTHVVSRSLVYMELNNCGLNVISNVCLAMLGLRTSANILEGADIWFVYTHDRTSQRFAG